MGGADADALEWRSLLSPRFAARLRQMGVTHVWTASDADVVVVTGLLTAHNLDAVVRELARMPSPSVLVAVGDCAINGGVWKRGGTARGVAGAPPGIAEYALSHYADVQVSVPGDPPTPQALIAALAAAAEILSRPRERLSGWEEE